jgi:hypothetical protein
MSRVPLVRCQRILLLDVSGFFCSVSVTLELLRDLFVTLCAVIHGLLLGACLLNCAFLSVIPFVPSPVH